MTAADARANAIRLLQQAEAETDRGLMDLFLATAAQWLVLAQQLAEVEAA